MQDVRITLRNLADEDTALHAKERRMVFESIFLVGQLEARNAAVNLNLSTEAFAARIGLTIDQWYKRCRAARIVARFPKVRSMLESGELKASHVEMIYPLITPANQNVLLEGIKGRGRREVEAFMRRVTAWGELLPDNEVQVEVKVTLTAEEAALLERAREILAAAGHVSGAKDVLVKALSELVERRDPAKKVERSTARAENTSAARQEGVSVTAEVGASPTARQKGPLVAPPRHMQAKCRSASGGTPPAGPYPTRPRQKARRALGVAQPADGESPGGRGQRPCIRYPAPQARHLRPSRPCANQP